MILIHAGIKVKPYIGEKAAADRWLILGQRPNHGKCKSSVHSYTLILRAIPVRVLDIWGLTVTVSQTKPKPGQVVWDFITAAFKVNTELSDQINSYVLQLWADRVSSRLGKRIPGGGAIQ